MNSVLTFLRGKKTYILVACGLVVGALDVTGVIDDASANTALTFLGLGTVATLRAGITNALAQAKADAAAANASLQSVPAAQAQPKS